MTTHERIVTTSAELIAATKDTSVQQIVVSGSLTNTPSVRLAPGQVLCGEDNQAAILFAGVDGLQLSSDNQVRCIHPQTAPDKRAIFVADRSPFDT